MNFFLLKTTVINSKYMSWVKKNGIPALVATFSHSHMNPLN